MSRNERQWVIVSIICIVLFLLVLHTHDWSLVNVCTIFHKTPNSTPDRRMLRALRAVMHLDVTERKVFSQNGEDGVIEALFQEIGERDKFYVEFGTEDGTECNTRYLRFVKGWRGLLMDSNHENTEINLHKEMIYPDNIVQLFKKYNVPKQFDLLSVDTDFKDYWILLAILKEGYRPRVIVVEVNTFLGWERSVSVPLETEEVTWDGSTQYFGFSLAAAWKLGRRFGYSLLYCERIGVNCFFVIDGKDGFGEGVRISDYLLPQHIFRPNMLTHSVDSQSRRFVNV